jgi:hypothetical protein
MINGEGEAQRRLELFLIRFISICYASPRLSNQVSTVNYIKDESNNTAKSQGAWQCEAIYSGNNRIV